MKIIDTNEYHGDTILKWLDYGLNSTDFNYLIKMIIKSYTNQDNMGIIYLLRRAYIKVRTKLNKHLPEWDLSLQQIVERWIVNNNYDNYQSLISETNIDHDVLIWISIFKDIISMLPGCLALIYLTKSMVHSVPLNYLSLYDDLDDIINNNLSYSLASLFDNEKWIWNYQKIPWNCMECSSWRTPYRPKWLWDTIEEISSKIHNEITDEIQRTCDDDEISNVIGAYISTIAATSEILINQFETFLAVGPKWAARETIGDIMLLASSLRTHSLEWSYLITSIDRRIGGCHKIPTSHRYGVRWVKKS